MKKFKKVAIVHDSLQNFGGAEQVLFELLDIYPQADLFTSLASKKMRQLVFARYQKKVHSSPLSNLAFLGRWSSLLKPYFFHCYWPKLKLDDYDLIICSSGSFMSHLVKSKSNKIVYLHSPAKFLYEEYNELNFLKKFPWRAIIAPYLNYLRKIDQQAIQTSQLLIANSQNIAQRVKKYYQLESKVVYPPIKKVTRKAKLKKENYYLFFSRLVKQKGIELTIKAFNINKKQLIVIGDGPKRKSLEKIAKKNIQFLGFIPEKELKPYIQQAQALIYPSIDEDFGIIPLEVIQLGTPVIAYRDHDWDFLNSNNTLFFKQYTTQELNRSIQQFETKKIDCQNCLKTAAKWQQFNFKQDWQQLISRSL